MGYTDHDWSEADATGAFPAFAAGRGRRPVCRQRPAARATPCPPMIVASRCPSTRRQCPSHLRQPSRHQYPSSPRPRDRAREPADRCRPLRSWQRTQLCRPAHGKRRPRGGRVSGGRAGLDGDTGIYPVADWYAGYEQYAREQDDRPGQPAAAEEQPLIRAYARPTDPREAPGHAGERPAIGYPPGDHPADGYPAGLPLADYPARSPLAGRLVRLQADRWLIAGGSLAAVAAVVVAFVMAGGSGPAAPGPGRRRPRPRTSPSLPA